jgi:enoyl-CoA hydratase/carnithine racemase
MTKTRFEIDGKLGILTLTNPPLNLISMEVIQDIEKMLGDIPQLNLRALLFRAEGDMFSAGVQIDDVFRGRSQSEAQAMLKRFNQALYRFERLPFPTLAAVQGDCLTAGLEMVLACDMAWAADSVNFGQVEAVIGATPMGGGTPRLTQRVGAARAAEIIMGASFYNAATFERWNIINRVLPKQELAEKSLKYAKKLSQGPTLAHAATKIMIRETLDNGISTTDKRLPEVASPLFESEDMKNGIEALISQGPGKAVFTGR